MVVGIAGEGGGGARGGGGGGEEEEKTGSSLDGRGWGVVGLSNLLKNLFRLSARFWSPSGRAPPFLFMPVIALVPAQTCFTPSSCCSCCSSLCLYASFPFLIFTFSSFCSTLTLSLSPSLKAFFFSFNKVFRLVVIYSLLFGKQRISLEGIMAS